MTAVFSNFIDIWNLHRSFFSALTSLLFRHNTLENSSLQTSTPISPTVTMTTSMPLSPLLLSHFPYLSLYTPFVTSFSTTLSTLYALITPPSHTTVFSNLEYNQRFATFVKEQETDHRCGKLKLRDWLLTIVQRCPRYLLLLKDLIECTSLDDPERAQLENVRNLVAKITTSLNTSLQTHAQTLSLLALQRATLNLPFQLISPGRTLLKRGTLIQVERSSPPREREFLLFSDCLIWLVREEDERAEKGEKVWGALAGLSGLLSSGEKSDRNGMGWVSKNSSRTSFGNGSKTNLVEPSTSQIPEPPHSAALDRLKRPPMVRTRSKSDAELTVLQARAAATAAGAAVMSSVVQENEGLISSLEAVRGEEPGMEHKAEDETQVAALDQMPMQGKRRSFAGPEQRARTRSSAPIPRLNKDKFKRNASSVDDGSWLAKDRKQRWVFRGKAELVDLEVVVPVKMRRRPVSAGDEVMREPDGEPTEEDDSERKWEILSPEGSFVLYGDTEQERDEWTAQIRQAKAQLLVSLNAIHPNSTLNSSSSTNHLRKTLQALPFSPDDESGDKKGKRRSRVEHWVPAIWIPDEKAEGCMRCGRAFGWRRRRHHCRLCGRCVCSGCSDRTFFISDPRDTSQSNKPARACNACYETVFPVLDPVQDEDETSTTPAGDDQSTVADAGTNFPSWLSMPSLTLSSLLPGSSSAPDLNDMKDRPKSRDLDTVDEGDQVYDLDSDEEERGRRNLQVVKSTGSSASRPRSYHQILEDFLIVEQGKKLEGNGEDASGGNDSSPRPSPSENNAGLLSPKLKREVSFAPSLAPSVASSKRHTVVNIPSRKGSQVLLGETDVGKENTARRNKRFSMPALAIQATSVTTRTALDNATPPAIAVPVGVPSGAGASMLGSPLGVDFPSGDGDSDRSVGGLPRPRTRTRSSGSLLFGRVMASHSTSTQHHHHHHHVLGNSDFTFGSKLKKSLKRDKSTKIEEERDSEETVDSQTQTSPPSTKRDLGTGVAAGKLSELLLRKKSKILG
ncbi:hypothetical protein L218DRAFT_294906 [Marasmius fiardii PR-910]|nr:hypothetical protein L218DRAFT_294906 [Marasmius fiardii PR-910]